MSTKDTKLERKRMKWTGFLLALCFPFALFADARIVEAPTECHFPYDNANTDNETKIAGGCNAFIRQLNGGNNAIGGARFIMEDADAGQWIIDGQDVRDSTTYPGGVLTITTSGRDSGTACNLVTADGTTYAAPNWLARTIIKRTESYYRVDVELYMHCNSGVVQ